MILEAVLLAQLTGTMHECIGPSAQSGIKYYSTHCEDMLATPTGPLSDNMSITGGLSITNAPMPKCDDGWQLVLDAGGQPMCAHEVKGPH